MIGRKMMERFVVVNAIVRFEDCRIFFALGRKRREIHFVRHKETRRTTSSKLLALARDEVEIHVLNDRIWVSL